jgi:hypothetical protein
VEGEEEEGFLPPCDFSEAKSRMRERSSFWLSPPAAMGSEGEAARGTLRRIRGARGGNGVGSVLFWSGGPSNQYRGLSWAELGALTSGPSDTLDESLEDAKNALDHRKDGAKLFAAPLVACMLT